MNETQRPALDAPTLSERLTAISSLFEFRFELVSGEEGRALRSTVWTHWFDSSEPVDMWTRARDTDTVALLPNAQFINYLDRLPTGLVAVGELHHDGSDDVILLPSDRARFVVNQFDHWCGVWDPTGGWFIAGGLHEVYVAGDEGRRITGLD